MLSHRTTLPALAVALLALPGLALAHDPPELEERLRALEEKLEAAGLSEETQQT